MLKKQLGLTDVFCLATGAMISSGLFVLPGIAFEKVGPAMILSYALASVFIVPSMFSQAELAAAMPKAGGSYFFIERSLGPFAGTMAGLLNWLSIALKTAFALIGIGAVAMQFFPQIGDGGMVIVAVSFCAFFTLINLVSVKSVGKMQIYLVFGLLAIVGATLLAGFSATDETHYVPFMKEGADWETILAVAGMVFVSYGGLTKVASVGEEVTNPGRNLPLGMFIASGVVSLLYVAMIFVTVGTVEAEALSGSLVPISLSAHTSMGKFGMIMVDVAALLAFITTANAGILSASRSPMAMSRDGLLPSVLAKTSAKFSTPYVAIFLTSGFIIAVIVFLTVEELVKTASTMMLLMFMLVNVAVIILRQSKLQSYRPEFKSPFYPWLQISAVIIYSFLIFEMGKVPLLLTAGFGILATIWYVFYVWRKIERESAFVYVVKSITSDAMGRSDLEDELRQISLERSGVEMDRFDHLVNDAKFIDIEEGITAKQLFERMSQELSERLDLNADELYEKFLAREKESSTVIKPGLAIPHVVIDGEGRFDMLVLRCKEGITFSELNRPVHTVFALIGTMDERNFHLRALMHIAHLISESEFEARWNQARGVEQLRDVVLLSRPNRKKNK
ncbi:amino acid permease [Acanthopleuribacter pedis]|uniref:Amino acid permease n=1 Tax=Acanthopleuribacter pedis TaxID=442870 RepID=A0A8J7QJA3_9BACT|nr:amino acid permease [Acanthopleuribacter pedis]MBO1321851.1 amino acid permease [Acanthopleuribacter pedis]